jgi:hypothetical protein
MNYEKTTLIKYVGFKFYFWYVWQRHDCYSLVSKFFVLYNIYIKKVGM